MLMTYSGRQITGDMSVTFRTYAIKKGILRSLANAFFS
jgi:hypothetical protein